MADRESPSWSDRTITSIRSFLGRESTVHQQLVIWRAGSQTLLPLHAHSALGVRITLTFCWPGVGVARGEGAGGALYPPSPVRIASMHRNVIRPARNIVDPSYDGQLRPLPWLWRMFLGRSYGRRERTCLQPCLPRRQIHVPGRKE
jgi:hypothetical protein